MSTITTLRQFLDRFVELGGEVTNITYRFDMRDLITRSIIEYNSKSHDTPLTVSISDDRGDSFQVGWSFLDYPYRIEVSRGDGTTRLNRLSSENEIIQILLSESRR